MEKNVTLTLTANCNLSCVYCYEKHDDNKSMSFDTAKYILDSEFEGLKNDDYITIDFFGGEPFLEFELIKKIVSYVREQNIKGRFLPRYRFFATTNGTLIHGEIMNFLKAHKNFYLGLSLDGTKWMHDTNRCNSFDKIDLDFFVKTYPEQQAKMTISDFTLPYLADGIIFAHNKNFKVACNLAYGIDWRNPKYKKLLIAQLEKLSEFYLDNPSIERTTILSRKISSIGYLHEQPKRIARKWCGTGTAMRTYDTDGKRYPCQFFMPMSCGKEKSSKAWEIDFKDEIPIEHLDKKCQHCILQDCCPTCYGSNYSATGDIYCKDPNLCELEKIIFYANAWLSIQLWGRGQLKDLTDDELSATIFAAKKIIESFESEINI